MRVILPVLAALALAAVAWFYLSAARLEPVPVSPGPSTPGTSPAAEADSLSGVELPDQQEPAGPTGDAGSDEPAASDPVGVGGADPAAPTGLAPDGTPAPTGSTVPGLDPDAWPDPADGMAGVIVGLADGELSAWVLPLLEGYELDPARNAELLGVVRDHAAKQVAAGSGADPVTVQRLAEDLEAGLADLYGDDLAPELAQVLGQLGL